jgi:serine protease Do
MTVWRKDASYDLQVTIGDAPENQQVAMSSDDRRGSADETKQSPAQALGLQFATLNGDLRRQLHIERDVHGAVITGVSDGGIADSLGLERGDIVISINQQPVRNAEDAAQMLKNAAHSVQKNALLLINRHGATRYLGVDLSRNQG